MAPSTANPGFSRRVERLSFVLAALLGCGSGLECRDGDFYLDDELFTDCAQCDGKCDFTSTFSYPNGVQVRDSVVAMCDGERATIADGVCEGASPDEEQETNEHTQPDPPPEDDAGLVLPSEPDLSTWTFEGVPLPLKDECRDMARRYCLQDEPCCAQLGMTFDRAYCEQNYLGGCARGAIGVLRGVKTFDPDALDHCIEVTTPHFEQCELAPTEAAAAELALDECSWIFVGGADIGERCAGDWECASTDEGGASCDLVDDECVLHPRLGEGEACVDRPGFCGLGLSCTDEGCKYLDDRIALIVACHP